MKIKTTLFKAFCATIFCSTLSFGQDSNALNFDGIDDQVNCGHTDEINITGTAITLEAWVKLDEFTTETWRSTILAKTVPFGGGYIFKAGGPDGQIEFTFGYPGTYVNFTSPTDVVTLDTWHHVAVSYDGSSVKLYVDGDEVLEAPETNSIGSSFPNALYLGNDNSFTPRYLPGSIDEVRVWNITRTAEEIDFFKDKKLCNVEGLVAYYQFDEGVAGEDNTGITTLPDNIGDNTGTLNVGMALMGESGNWVEGVEIEELEAVGVDMQTACGEFTWIDDVTYTEDNDIATFTLTNIAGCDSVVTLNLTINSSTEGTDMQTACGEFTWIDDVTYTEDNDAATFVLTNAAGCDSVVTLNLTINSLSEGTDMQTACNEFTWIDDVTYTEDNNTATFTLTNAAGCDSVVTLDLTINAVDASISTSMLTITADAVGATYQWVDCVDDSPIDGETGQSFTATENGEYAVIVTEGDCSSTSECVTIASVGLNETAEIHNLNVYPNPAKGMTVIELDNTALTTISIVGLDSKVIYTTQLSGDTRYDLSLENLSPSIYFLIVENNEAKSIVKLIKQ